MNYCTGFASVLIDAGKHVLNSDLASPDAHRAALYIALLSCELTLKALLERAGVPVARLVKISHKLSVLLETLSECEVFLRINDETLAWVSASRVRALPVKYGATASTLGRLLSLEAEGASVYPNSIRYGNAVSHAPAGAMLKAAEALHDWATNEGSTIKLRMVT